MAFQLVDDPSGGIALIVEQLVPDEAIQIARLIIGQHILVNFLKEFPEDVVQDQEINSLWRILLVNGFYVLKDLIRHILNVCGVGPDLIKQ
ncbi:hypothetical protein PUV47_16480 [Pseudovibrio exalbescens]|uniref:hypothetical protein n=1 Tax=Pseudovibrio exalbescens TaxID=197461 RepID=UPI002365ABEC|nr:hypothetical protein [Pseudovibrio exalbescens]MDD7911529.1 hypothetical protein [Pseudovibrio exalbescens]